MSLKEFWEESPELFWIYRFNWLKSKIEEENDMNRNAWYIGIYVRQAIVSSLSDSKKPVEYYSKPIDLYATEEDKKKEIVNKNVALLKAQFIRNKKILDSKKKKEKDKGEQEL